MCAVGSEPFCLQVCYELKTHKLKVEAIAQNLRGQAYQTKRRLCRAEVMLTEVD